MILCARFREVDGGWDADGCAGTSDASDAVSSIALESMGGGSSVIVAVPTLVARRRVVRGNGEGVYRGKGDGGYCDRGDEFPLNAVSIDSICAKPAFSGSIVSLRCR